MTPRSPVSIPLLGVLLFFALLLVALATGLRPDSFFAGDPGVKLIATREALAHPTRPLEVDLPRIAGAAVPDISPFFLVHGTHAHAVTSPLFPVLTAPMLRAFGLRGVYFLPALGFLIVLGAAAHAARSLDPERRGAIVALTIGLGSPLVFYGLELWEHSLAVATGTTALALMLGGWPTAAGVAFGVAVLLRPEAVWFGVAVLLASPLLPFRPATAQWVRALVGALIAFAPLEIYTIVHFQTVVPFHVGSNVGNLSQGWLAGRAALLKLWFLGGTTATFWRVGPVVLGALGPWLFPPRGGRWFLWTVTIVDIALVLLTAPNDGGGQWGPRYLLFAYVPLGILAADGVTILLAARARSTLAWPLVAAVALGAAWIQRDGYRSLRGTKAIYGRIVDLVRTELAPDTALVSDLWWLDQIAAAATAGRPVLYAGSDTSGRAIVHRLSEAAVTTVTIVRSATESPDTTAWSDGTCFIVRRRTRLSVRDLVVVRLERQC